MSLSLFFFSLFHGVEELTTSFANVLSPGNANKWNEKIWFVIRLLFHLQLVVLISHDEDCELNHSECNCHFPNKKCFHSCGFPIEWNCAAFHCWSLVFTKDTDDCWITEEQERKKWFTEKNTFLECWPKWFSNVISHHWIVKDDLFDSTFVSQCNAGALQISHLLWTQMIAESLRKWKEKVFHWKKLFWSVDLSDSLVQSVITELLRTIGPMALFVPQSNLGPLLVHWGTRSTEFLKNQKKKVFCRGI